MAQPIRVTAPLLDVLEVLFRAFESNSDDLHGWAIIKATKRTGPTVYGVLDRLEEMGWIRGRWEEQNPEPSKPRRRFYSITPTAAPCAQQLLVDRRPQALSHLEDRTTHPSFPGCPQPHPTWGCA